MSDNWLDDQLEKARQDFESWPQWLKDSSRSGEYIRKRNAELQQEQNEMENEIFIDLYSKNWFRNEYWFGLDCEPATCYIRKDIHAEQLAARDAVIEEYAKTFHSLDFVLANALNEMSAAYAPDHSRACGYAQLEAMRRIIGETYAKIEALKQPD